jgi:hypothetical protein
MATIYRYQTISVTGSKSLVATAFDSLDSVLAAIRGELRHGFARSATIERIGDGPDQVIEWPEVQELLKKH